MSQSAVLPISPPRSQSDAGEDIFQTTALILTQNLEDIRLAERIRLALHATGYGALRAIEVSVNDRIVRLMGRVPSYHLKQVAQSTALAISGTRHIHNGLNVTPPN